MHKCNANQKCNKCEYMKSSDKIKEICLKNKKSIKNPKNGVAYMQRK